ncbi:homoserine O-acetyltransferase [Intrasporangium sp.]|uniref:homoserine O-acetyltransferase MetX n=1 Tax=Intrasporangium sp. TaxID=1925024 RepID=UPI003221C872
MTVTHRHQSLTHRARPVGTRPVPTPPTARVGRVRAGRPDDGTWRAGDPVGEREFLDIGTIRLERAGVLPQVRVAYETWGTLAPGADNVVLVEHALTGDSHVVGPQGPGHPTPGWWEGLVGPGRALDTNRWFVICANVLGGCQGTTGPVSPAPDGRYWAARFPYVTIRDQVQVEQALLRGLGIRRVAAVIGGSMGGMRAIEWAVMGGDLVERAIVLASTAHATADQIAWAQPQLLAIRSDVDFAGGDYYDTGRTPENGLGIARRIAHITYRTETELNGRFGRDAQSGEDPLRPAARGRFAVEGYLDHHASKLTGRFDANSYLVLTEAMNSHDVGRDRGGLAEALRGVAADCTIASVDTDRLYPPPLSDEMARLLPNATRESVTSVHGHDGFLIETDQVAGIVRRALGRPVG